jgi:hypothetical protein
MTRLQMHYVNLEGVASSWVYKSLNRQSVAVRVIDINHPTDRKQSTLLEVTYEYRPEDIHVDWNSLLAASWSRTLVLSDGVP